MTGISGDAITFTHSNVGFERSDPGVAVDCGTTFPRNNTVETLNRLRDVASVLVFAADGIARADVSGSSEPFIMRSPDQHASHLEVVAEKMAEGLLRSRHPGDYASDSVFGGAIYPYRERAAQYWFGPEEGNEHLQGKRLQIIWERRSGQFVLGLFGKRDFQSEISPGAVATAFNDVGLQQKVEHAKMPTVSQQQPATIPTVSLLRRYDKTDVERPNMLQLGHLEETLQEFAASTKGFTVKTFEAPDRYDVITSVNASLLHEARGIGLYILGWAIRLKRGGGIVFRGDSDEGDFTAVDHRERPVHDLGEIGVGLYPFFRDRREWRSIPQSEFVIPRNQRRYVDQLGVLQADLVQSLQVNLS